MSSKRIGQTGSLEKSGNWIVVRWWQDVEGQEKRVYKRAQICPTEGLPGHLNICNQKKRAYEIVNSGATYPSGNLSHSLAAKPLISRQITPCFRPEIVSGLAKWGPEPERTLFILSAASGLRPKDALELEIDKHISPDFLTITVKQRELKTRSSVHKVEVHSSIAAMLRNFVGERRSGLLFCSTNGTPLNAASILRNHLHPALKQLGYINPFTRGYTAGFHAFRRFRRTYLANYTQCPEDLQRFWMGHAPSMEMMRYHFSMERIAKIRENDAYRKAWAEKCGLGFELPPTAPNELQVEDDCDGNKAA